MESIPSNYGEMKRMKLSDPLRLEFDKQLSEEINHSGVPYEYGVISKMAENLARLPKFAKIGEKLTFSRSWFKNFREIWPQRKAARIPPK